MASMKDYDSFHRMIANPLAAKRCICSFKDHNGCILFMPSTRKDNELILYECSHGELNLFSYYMLVILSLTGLSTMLGMTETIDLQDYSQNNGEVVWPPSKRSDEGSKLLKSKVEEQIFLKDCDLQYVQRHMNMIRSVSVERNKHDTEVFSLRIRRRFEYDFHLTGLNVIMLHLVSPKNPDVLHLLEVYRVRNRVLREFFRLASSAFGNILHTFYKNIEKTKKE